jgi:hypothetical protein
LPWSSWHIYHVGHPNSLDVSWGFWRPYIFFLIWITKTSVVVFLYF